MPLGDISFAIRCDLLRTCAYDVRPFAHVLLGLWRISLRLFANMCVFSIFSRFLRTYE